MFIYSVTHIPTKRFYIGFDQGPIKTMNLELDPMMIFKDQTKGYNDAYVMTNVVKELLIKIGDIAEAQTHLANLAKHYESNPQFLGIQLGHTPPAPKENVTSLADDSTEDKPNRLETISKKPSK